MNLSLKTGRKKMELVIATGNAKKLGEILAILAGLPLRVLSLADFPEVAEPAEDGLTFEANARKKAAGYARGLGRPVLAEDSGLEVAALDGAPGIRSARFAGPGKRDADNIALLLERLKEVAPADRRARFVSVVALAAPDGRTTVFRGVREGLITGAPRGSNGFGYDPVFLVPELGRTFAELAAGEKNRLSHRRQALELAREFLASPAGREFMRRAGAPPGTG